MSKVPSWFAVAYFVLCTSVAAAGDKPLVVMNGAETRIGKAFLSAYGPIDRTIIARNEFTRADHFVDEEGVYYHLEYAVGMEGFQYYLFLSKTSCTVYFVRTGGFFGNTEAFGPIDLKDRASYCGE